MSRRGRRGGAGILVLEAGTSMLDFALFAAARDGSLVRTASGRLDRLYAGAHFRAVDATGAILADLDCADDTPPGHRTAIEFLFSWLEHLAGAVPVRAVGHNVLHGGPAFAGPARIDAPTLRYLQALVPLAPARQRVCVLAIRVIARRWPGLPQVACFETAFRLGVPVLDEPPHNPRLREWSSLQGYRYDGLVFEAVSDALPSLDRRAAEGRTILLHIGDDAGLCAFDGRRRVAMTGAGDLRGSGGTASRRTRSADARPRGYGLPCAPSRVRRFAGPPSERFGRSGAAEVLDRLASSDDPRAHLALERFLDRIGWKLEAFTDALSGLDALVFSAGDGPHAIPVRAGICRRASHLGVDLDPAANQAGGPRLTRPRSRVTAWVIRADTPLLIARRARAVLDLESR